jgi:PHD/YefM family antitoxin component YafN of YafNO toxin-antitoxin module
MSARRTITIKSNKPIAVISIEEYESMKETIELLSQNPNLVRKLKAERRKIGKGDFISFEDFKKKYRVK